MQNRLNFSVVGHIFQNNGGEKYDIARIRAWIADAVCFSGECDRSNFSNSFNKGKPLAREIYDYYENSKNLPEIAKKAEENLLAVVPSVSTLVSELQQAVYGDKTILPETAEELLSGTDGEIVAKVLRYSIIRQKTEKADRDGSPKIEHFWENIQVPHIATSFVGRAKELEEIKTILFEKKLLYVSGIGGIGKSELVQEYARRQRRYYRNILYFTYQTNLKKTILIGNYADNGTLTEEERYRRTIRLLNSLKEDSLVIIDDLSRLPEQDSDFSLLRKLSCHTLVTTRLNFDNSRTYYLHTMSDPKDLLYLFYTYCPYQNENRTGEEDILYLTDLVHGHTYTIQMLALTVKEGFSAVWELSQLIREYGLDFPNDVSIATQKDDCDQYEPFFVLLEKLFHIQRLNGNEKNTLQNFSIMPLEGVTKRKFAEWSRQTKEVQYLIRLGWIQEDKTTDKIYMHGLVRDMVVEILHPNIQDCEIMICALLNDCKYIADEDGYTDYENMRELNYCTAGIIDYLREDSVFCALYFTLFAAYSIKMQHIGWKNSFQALGFENDSFNRITMEYMMLANLTFFMQNYSGQRRVLDDIKWRCDGLGGRYLELWALADEKLEENKALYERLSRKIELEKRIAPPGLKKRISSKGKHSGGKKRSSHREKYISTALKDVFSKPDIAFLSYKDTK